MERGGGRGGVFDEDAPGPFFPTLGEDPEQVEDCWMAPPCEFDAAPDPDSFEGDYVLARSPSRSAEELSCENGSVPYVFSPPRGVCELPYGYPAKESIASCGEADADFLMVPLRDFELLADPDSVEGDHRSARSSFLSAEDRPCESGLVPYVSAPLRGEWEGPFLRSAEFPLPSGQVLDSGSAEGAQIGLAVGV